LRLSANPIAGSREGRARRGREPVMGGDLVAGLAASQPGVDWLLDLVTGALG
jgi:hypothetical protein